MGFKFFFSLRGSENTVTSAEKRKWVSFPIFFCTLYEKKGNLLIDKMFWNQISSILDRYNKKRPV